MIIYRKGSSIYEIEIDEQSIFSQTLMGEEKIVISYVSSLEMLFKIGDYIIHQGYEFHIREEVLVEQINNFTYRYEITFYSDIYSLYDEVMIHLNRTSFSYMGTPTELLGLLLSSIEASGWTVGQVANIPEPIKFDFQDISCRVALTDIAQKFQLEYFVIGKQINLVDRVGIDRNITFSYGKQNGAYKLLRQKVDKAYATVWYAYGGNQNIPANYRQGTDRITLATPYEINTELYGRKKGIAKFDYIYPRRTGTITSVVNLNKVIDSSIDFDLNQQIIGDTAKIVFKSGELSGLEFTIIRFDISTKEIEFASNKDETGYVTPNTTFEPQIGDQYTFVGIIMPQNYIDAAEAELYTAITEYANLNSRPPFSITPDVDEKYIRENNLKYIIQAGDRVNVSGLQYSGLLRVQTITYPLVNPNRITLQLSDTIIYSISDQIVQDVKQTKRIATSTSKKTLFVEKLTQEVAANVLLNQFEKTYVGELCVMSGAFVVGNPAQGQIGGVNGAGEELTEVVFFAGSTYENRAIAPFRAIRDGSVYMSKLEVANGCKIGGFSIQDNILYRRTNENPVTPNTTYTRIGSDFIFRKTLQDFSAKEVLFDIGSQNYSVKIGNSTNPVAGQDVIGLSVYASGATAGAKSIAIEIDGGVRMTSNSGFFIDSHQGASQTITLNGTTLIFRNGILTTT